MVDCVFDSPSELLDEGNSQLRHLNSAPVLSDIDFKGPSAFMSIGGARNFPVIFDTGASLAVSGHKDDFVGKITAPEHDLRLGGMGQGMKIEGIGVVNWTFVNKGTELTIQTQCYYVPQARARLISPQRLFRKSEGVTGSFLVEEDITTLTFTGHSPLHVEYDPRSNLPIGYGCNAAENAPQVNLCVTDDTNQNLTPSQKLLLQWHHRFGHLNLPGMQRLLRVAPFGGEKLLSASRCTIPRCDVCEFAKGRRQPTGGKKSTAHPHSTGALKDSHLRAGSAVSVDHFESRLKGRTYTSYGKTTSDQYVGGCIFVDHMSGYIHVEHQLGFSSTETIRAKQNYEQFALGNGVIVTDYLADNGIFKANAFVQHLREHNQRVQYCGVNAHHQNGVDSLDFQYGSGNAAACLHPMENWN
jgi:hypothetical protein